MISPLYESAPPAWVKKNIHLLEGAVLIRNLGSEERRLNKHEQVFGANIAFRKWVVDRWKFDTNYGPAGKELLLGDETMFIENLHQNNLYGVWVPEAKVQHFVPQKRTSLNFVHRYFVAMGRTQVRLDGAPEGKRILGVPRSLFRQWAESISKAYFYRSFGSNKWFTYFLNAAELKGRIIESKKKPLTQVMS